METYSEFISHILETRGRFACDDEYHETHHITPKCCGGTDDKDNLIDLFAREHFIAHKLLAQENPENSSLVYAWYMMANIGRVEISPEEYEEAKKYFSYAHSDAMSGENNPMFGKSHSENVKERLRDVNTGKKMSEESKIQMSESHKGKKTPYVWKALFGKRKKKYE